MLFGTECKTGRVLLNSTLISTVLVILDFFASNFINDATVVFVHEYHAHAHSRLTRNCNTDVCVIGLDKNLGLKKFKVFMFLFVF